MSCRNESVTRRIPTSLCEHIIPSGFTGIPAMLTLTALTGTGMMLLLTCPSMRDERKLRVSDQLLLLPAASIRDDLQGFIISLPTMSQLLFPVDERMKDAHVRYTKLRTTLCRIYTRVTVKFLRARSLFELALSVTEIADLVLIHLNDAASHLTSLWYLCHSSSTYTLCMDCTSNEDLSSF